MIRNHDFFILEEGQQGPTVLFYLCIKQVQFDLILTLGGVCQAAASSVSQYVQLVMGYDSLPPAINSVSQEQLEGDLKFGDRKVA